MRRTKMSMDTNTRYTSLEELRAAWGLKPLAKKRTKDMKKFNENKMIMIHFEPDLPVPVCGESGGPEQQQSPFLPGLPE